MLHKLNSEKMGVLVSRKN